MAPPKRFTPPARKPAPDFGRKPKKLPKRAPLRLPRFSPFQFIGDQIGLPTDPFQFLAPPQAARSYTFNPGSSWVKVASCGPAIPPYEGVFFSGTGNTSCTGLLYTCLTNQAGPNPNGPNGGTEPFQPTFAVTGSCGRITLEARRFSGISPRYQYLDVWRAPNGTPVESATWKNPREARGPVPMPAPRPDPFIDPLTDPWPTPAPIALPQPMPSTVVLPGPTPGSPGVPVPVPTATPLPSPSPGAPPYVAPGNSIVILPGTGVANPVPIPVPRPGHARIRPPRGTREVKISTNGVTELLKGAINLVTESADAVNAMFYAIDANDRAIGGAVGFMSPLDKASFIWSNFHLVNWDEFVKNFFKNAVEDWFYGQLGRGSAWMQQQGGISKGFKDAALTGGSSAGTSRGNADNPVLDAINEFIDSLAPADRGFNTPGRRAFAAKPVVKNWRRINKWTKRERK